MCESRIDTLIVIGKKRGREQEMAKHRQDAILHCIYQQYVGLAYYIAFDILQNKEDAEDAVQETFVRIIKNISKISDPFCTKIKNFVIIICRNVSLDMMKKRELAKMEKLSDCISNKHYEADPYDVVSENESLQIIVDAVHELPYRYKDCIYMKLVLELDYQEIADILKQKAETVRKRLQRGKKILSKKLEGIGISFEG